MNSRWGAGPVARPTRVREHDYYVMRNGVYQRKRTFYLLPDEDLAGLVKPDWMSQLVFNMMGLQANDVTLERGTPLEFKSSSHAPAAANDLGAELTPTTVDLTLGLTGGIADGSAMNSDKFDYGANRAERYAYMAALEWFAAPTTGGAGSTCTSRHRLIVQRVMLLRVIQTGLMVIILVLQEPLLKD